MTSSSVPEVLFQPLKDVPAVSASDELNVNCQLNPLFIVLIEICHRTSIVIDFGWKRRHVSETVILDRH